MKKVRFDKLVTLIVEPKEEETLVLVNGAKFYLEDWVLKEEVDKLTVKKAKEIEAKYKKNKDWQYDPKDIEAIQEEAKKYRVKEEVKLYIDESEIMDKINKLLDK